MAKQYSASTMIGDAGVALIHRRTNEMGFVWHPRQHLDIGIDGDIELVEPGTNAGLNRLISVQSKASERPFARESDDSFDYVAHDEDLAYWRQATNPVILICSHPNRGESWWAQVGPGAGLEQLDTNRIHFEKRTQRFDASAVQPLLKLAAPELGAAIILTAEPQQLTSNLLRVEDVTPYMFVAPAAVKTYGQADARLKSHGRRQRDWLLHGDTIISTRDLRDAPFDVLCAGPPDTLDITEWADSSDPETQRLFVQLLNRIFSEMTKQDLQWYKDGKYRFFRASEDLTPRRVATGRSQRGRTVFKGYAKKKSPDEIAFYRHDALRHQFTRLDSEWYLVLDPTYHFTSDGYRDHPHASDYLSKLKRMERSKAVLDSTRTWAHWLRNDLLILDVDSPIRFGNLVAFTSDVRMHEPLTRRPHPDIPADEEGRLF